VEWALGTPVDLGLRMGAAMVTAGRVPEEGDVVSLVAAAREGDRGAFGRLYERYARMVHGILLGRVPVGEVEDLVQDVFVRAMRQVHTLRDVHAFGWPPSHAIAQTIITAGRWRQSSLRRRRQVKRRGRPEGARRAMMARRS